MTSFNPYADILAKAAALPDPTKRNLTRKEAEYIKVAKDLAAIIQQEIKIYDVAAHSSRNENDAGEMLLMIWSQKPPPASWAGQAWQAGARWAFGHIPAVIDDHWALVPKVPTDAMASAPAVLAPAVATTVYKAMIAAAPKYGEKK